MITEPTIQEINRIFQLHLINDEIVKIQRLSGTTSGRVYRLDSNQNNNYILKFDEPNQIQMVEQLLNTYQNSVLLPNVLFTAQDKSHFIYTYINGTTHINRGSKKKWLTILVNELFNKYSKYQHTDIWGRLEYPLRSWREFNEISIEEARINIGNSLTTDDYIFVKSQIIKLFGEEIVQGEKYLLHGDTGVHNFVFDQFSLIGVIDPSPMVGPLIYDFIYAFCSSPDDINIDTLFAAQDNLKQGHIDKIRLIDEVSVQLYCRVGLSVKHHPNDLSEYLKAWEHWKELCKKTQ
ncbi:phosphotransferase [Paenibacillus apii]|uniref:phosphotransferase n=1 Tax=Paenibacillus apii TaxID=1850370 RepID=UPI00143B0E21|nr:phosphotransferase [Paenibacillus apii]NJJ41126.1 phosphotransferase [Paenibacillus apii]